MLGLTHTLAFAAIAVKTNRYSSDHKDTFPFSCSQFPLYAAFYTLLTFIFIFKKATPQIYINLEPVAPYFKIIIEFFFALKEEI